MTRLPHRSLAAPSFVWILALLAACAGRVENVWTDPSLEGRSLGLRKVATIALLQEGGMRRVAEDELARAIEAGAQKNATGVEAVPSYTLLGTDELRDAEHVRSTLESAGFDGAVVIAIVGTEQRVTATATPTYGRWGGPGWGTMYDTRTVRTDTIVRVQTNIYAIGEGKLLWSGTSRSLNPRDVSRVVSDVVRDVGNALRKQGLIP